MLNVSQGFDRGIGWVTSLSGSLTGEESVSKLSVLWYKDAIKISQTG